MDSDSTRKWKRSRSQTARIEEASVLGALHFYHIKAASFEHRMAKFQHNWQQRVQEFATTSKFTPKELKAATYCRPCAIVGATQWACEFRFCPFCYARCNADILRRWKRAEGTTLVSFRDMTFQQRELRTREATMELMPAVRNAQRRWQRRFSASVGAVYRMTPIPAAENGIWTFKLSGIAVFDGEPDIKAPDGARLWYTPNTVKELTRAIARTMRYPPEWFYGNATRLASMGTALTRSRYVRYCGSFYRRDDNGFCSTLSDNDSDIADVVGYEDTATLGSTRGMLVDRHGDD